MSFPDDDGDCTAALCGKSFSRITSCYLLPEGTDPATLKDGWEATATLQTDSSKCTDPTVYLPSGETIANPKNDVTCPACPAASKYVFGLSDWTNGAGPGNTCPGSGNYCKNCKDNVGNCQLSPFNTCTPCTAPASMAGSRAVVRRRYMY